MGMDEVGLSMGMLDGPFGSNRLCSDVLNVNELNSNE